MKLKVISINGYYIFVDERAEIEANDYFYNTRLEEIVYATLERINWIKDKEQQENCFKIFFTSREIITNSNFNIPIIEDWKEWDIRNAADNYAKSFINYEEGMEEHFIKGCQYMKDLYPSRVYPKYVEVVDSANTIKKLIWE